MNLKGYYLSKLDRINNIGYNKHDHIRNSGSVKGNMSAKKYKSTVARVFKADIINIKKDK